MNTYGTNQRQVRENVLTLLETSERTRNSDRLLLLSYWHTYDGINLEENFSSQFILSSTNPESITRARRSIQSAGLFLPTEEDVLRKRRMLAEEARVHHANE